MQLKQTKPNLKALLTTASCALLGGTVQAETDESWQFDTAIMQYAEVDRVMATEAIIAGQKTFSNDQVLNLKLTIDALTGASPNGATAQPTPQTFTRPSGNGQYVVDAGETPLDDTFKDTRVQLTGQWTQPLWQDYTVSAGGNFSKEYDYMSASINGNIAKDFNKKNTTLSMGMAYAYDVIEPEGGIPKPFAAMVIGDSDDPSFEGEFNSTRISSDDSKSTIDLLFGITQVINRQMIVQLNYSYSTVSGYLTDPFKVLSLVNENGEAQEYLYEHRPDERTKHAFFGQTKYHFDSGILDASYRFMTDDWKIDSHTIDVRYLIPFENGHYIEPHIRLYTQSAAEFYQPFLEQANSLPEYASADYRIGELDTYTVGIKYGMPMGNGNKLAFRLEYYHQTPKSNGTQAIGALKDVELYEQVDAIIAQVTYSF
ncbi:MAG: DUF3570 domain-containing protein [Colwellia sp.]|nr:DUF3570 domain-containing protein [Colwellia sp.]MCW8865614.1 DUF3570 domain-containing protein [Colwellia sp.]